MDGVGNPTCFVFTLIMGLVFIYLSCVVFWVVFIV